ncbi:MAG: hypothetical protein COB23_02820 [Methylophaga sp.]|nr:MAG: hypothetical protein COB23_02820 [Methylophaga sp.]
MQINGAHLTTAFIPKSFGFQDKVRAPVTIDVIAKFDIEAPSQSTSTQSFQQVTAINDPQQSRFVRLLATTNNTTTNTDQSSSALIPLPRSVQQYLQIANLNSENQRLLDETV